MCERDIERLANYFRFFYFHKEMTFREFLDKCERYGKVPQRQYVDWSQVEGLHEQVEV